MFHAYRYIRCSMWAPFCAKHLCSRSTQLFITLIRMSGEMSSQAAKIRCSKWRTSHIPGWTITWPVDRSSWSHGMASTFTRPQSLEFLFVGSSEGQGIPREDPRCSSFGTTDLGSLWWHFAWHSYQGYEQLGGSTAQMLGTEGGPHWAPYVTVSMEPVNAFNFLRNEDIWKRTSPLRSSSTSSPKTCIQLPPSQLKCSTWIQYGHLQNGGLQGHPT
jgi:hypothetical protein